MIIRRLPGRDSKAMTKAILELNEELRGLIKSITSDPVRNSQASRKLKPTELPIILPTRMRHMNAEPTNG